MTAAEVDFESLDVEAQLELLMRGQLERRLAAYGRPEDIADYGALAEHGFVVPESEEVRRYREQAIATVGSAGFLYDDVNDPDWPKYAAAVMGRKGVDVQAFLKDWIAAGVRVFQYINLIDVGGYVGGSFDARFSPKDAPHLGFGEWPGFYVVDLSNAAWVAKLKEAFKWAITQPNLTDVFMDVFGTQFYTNWSKMSAAQKDTHSKVITELAYAFGEIRDQYRPDAFIVANGTHPNGHPALKACIEHHSTSEIPFWTTYLSKGWDKTGGWTGFVIAQGLSDGATWANVSNVGLVAAQPTYGQLPSAIVSGLRTRIAGRGGGVVTPPPPPPPPSLSVPTAPRSVMAVLGPVGGSVLVTWAANPLAEKVKDYQVYLGGTRVRDVTDLSCTLTGLAPGTYQIRVSARNGDVIEKGFGPWSDPAVEITVPVPTPPPPPPPTDPCADVKAELKAAQDALAIANDQLAKHEAFQAEVLPLLSDAERRLKAVSGRLGTVTGTGPQRWKNLTDAQKESLRELMRNQQVGEDKITAFLADHT